MPAAPVKMPSLDKPPRAAQPQAVSVPPPAIPIAPCPTQVNHYVTPKFALPLGQAPCAPMQDPTVQVLMLQQMAALLSMQAAMLQAGQAPAQSHPSVQMPAHQPVPRMDKDLTGKVREEKISVGPNTLTSTEFYPEFTTFAEDEPAKLPTDFICDPLPTYPNLLSLDHKLEIGKKNFQDTPVQQGVAGVPVKNTFLDFEAERRPGGMRAVQTCLGGFSFMTGADEDDDDA